MVKITCPLLGGKGSVPVKYSGLIAYYTITGDSVPHEVCPGCVGSGIQTI